MNQGELERAKTLLDWMPIAQEVIRRYADNQGSEPPTIDMVESIEDIAAIITEDPDIQIYSNVY